MVSDTFKKVKSEINNDISARSVLFYTQVWNTWWDLS